MKIQSILTATFLMATAVMSQVSYAAKFGLIDMQAIILNVAEGKEARATLEKEIKAKEADFTKRREERDKMNKDWQSQSALMSEEARMNKQKEFQEKFMSFRNDEGAFRDDVKKKEQKATQSIAAKVEAMVQKIAKEKGIDVVFEVNSAGLLYVNQPIDLTKDIIETYGKGDVSKKDAGAQKK